MTCIFTRRIWFPITLLLLAPCLSKAEENMHPISRLARLFDSQLVTTENRLLWLHDSLQTLAKPNEHSLKTGLGHRGGQIAYDDSPPQVTLDLGRVMPIHMVYLVPSQPEFSGDPGIFPRQITLECDEHEDFSHPTQIHRTTGKSESVDPAAPNAYPANANARYVRLTVHQGEIRGDMEIFGLSEIVVTSGEHPVSFGASVRASCTLQKDAVWSPEALVDGRTPLGIWQLGPVTSPTKGEAVSIPHDEIPVSWQLDLTEMRSLDYVVLFPYEINRSFGTFILPEHIRLELFQGETSVFSTEWINPSMGSSHLTPLVLPVRGVNANRIVMTALKPWALGDQRIHAFSEVEVWSGFQNVAISRTMTQMHRGALTRVDSLTDGYTSIQKIIHVGAWLDQLQRRSKNQAELQRLQPIHRAMEARSELNAAWGSAVLLGLGFLVPVYVFERRRLMSKRHLGLLRKRIASDLHDDIGSNLGSISLIARTARNDLIKQEGPESVAHDLSELEAIARESSLAMRDIVWLLERQQDTIGDLYQRMRDTSSRLLREMEVTMECESTCTTSRLALDAKRHLFLFYKEAIHNMIKHSQATKAQIRMWDEKDTLMIEVTDNGVGMKSKTGETNTSVAKLDDRARMLGGQLRIISSPDQGTCVRLEVKRSYLARPKSFE